MERLWRTEKEGAEMSSLLESWGYEPGVMLEPGSNSSGYFELELDESGSKQFDGEGYKKHWVGWKHPSHPNTLIEKGYYKND